MLQPETCDLLCLDAVKAEQMREALPSAPVLIVIASPVHRHGRATDQPAGGLDHEVRASGMKLAATHRCARVSLVAESVRAPVHRERRRR